MEQQTWQKIGTAQRHLAAAEAAGDTQLADSLLRQLQELHRTRLQEEREYTPLECPHCGPVPFWVAPHTMHGYGIFCSRCGRWVRWLGKGKDA